MHVAEIVEQVCRVKFCKLTRSWSERKSASSCFEGGSYHVVTCEGVILTEETGHRVMLLTALMTVFESSILKLFITGYVKTTNYLSSLLRDEYMNGV